MRLLTELATEQKLTMIINIHDVPLAQMFAQRIIGLKFGEVVYDGPASGLNDDRLTDIYGAEDWASLGDRATAEV